MISIQNTTLTWYFGDFVAKIVKNSSHGIDIRIDSGIKTMLNGYFD